tara:strand:+ start:47 stop:295 length:249 start_codon:yes stop_codon:yes gene_type:complete
MSKTYCIIDASDVASVDFSQVYETSADTLRYNFNADKSKGDKTFVKYTGSKPRFLYGKDTYTHSQMLEILSQDEWTPATPDE